MTHALHDQAPDPIRPHELTRIVLRPLATPLPLGILALAFGSILLTALQLQWLPPADGSQVAAVVLVLVVPLEVIAAVVAFLIRDVVMATGFGLLVGGWAASSVLLLMGRPGELSPVLGTVAIALAGALLVPAASAAAEKPAAAVLFTVAAVRFGLTGAYELGAGDHWATVSGAFGLVLVTTAAYSALAFALEDARHRPV
ncbi:hypothetical protein, partial [Jatrophihabitans endophyticus]|uniref:hypothetical protein n=1 Tax=Jatrophihabitans endophyticus TaxID=1206085 RepID=UPI0019EE087F